MNMTQERLQGYWKYSLVGALVIGGAIAFSDGHAFAQSYNNCPGGQLCQPIVNPQPVWHRPGQPFRRIPPRELEELEKRYPQAIRQLQHEDPQAVEKLKQLDPETVERLERLAPNSRQQLQRYTRNVTQ